MKRTLSCFFLYSLGVTSLFSQANLSVDIGDPVYHLIEVGELRGIFPSLSQIKPYSHSQVTLYLNEMLANLERFTPSERKSIQQMTDRFSNEWKGLKYLNYASKGEKYNIQLGVQAEAHARGSYSDLGGGYQLDYAPNLLLELFMRGDLTKYFSYEGSVGFGWDYILGTPVNDFDPNYSPYSYNRDFDAVVDKSLTYHLGGEFGAQFLDDRVWIRFAREERNIGPGTGGLMLNENAHPFNAVEYRARVAPWLNLYQMVGNLTQETGEAGGRVTNEELETGTGFESKSAGITYRKNYTLQGFELFPFKGFYFGASASVIWAGGFDWGYLLPMIFVFPYQNTRWNYDNVAFEATLSYVHKNFGKIYASLYLDELSFISGDLSNPRSTQIAYQGGYKLAIPGLPLTTISLQYTKVEPYTYSHYLVDHPSLSYIYDTSYTNDGESIGYSLQPNSNEVSVEITTQPLPNWRFSLDYQLIGHGTNLDRNSYKGSVIGDSSLPVQGNLGDSLDYEYAPNYANKNFTKDGVYDWTNVLTAKANYYFFSYPAELYLFYTFSHTSWKTNGFPTVADPINDNSKGVIPGYGNGSNQIRHILGLGGKIDY